MSRAADDFFWTFQYAQSYYQFALVNCIGFYDRGMLLAGGYGDPNVLPQIDKTEYLERAYTFGRKFFDDPLFDNRTGLWC